MIPKILPVKKTLYAANNSVLKTRGIWYGKFNINGNWFRTKFFVCSGLSHEVILGNTFFREARPTIDYTDLTITFEKKGKKFTVNFGKFYSADNEFIQVFTCLDVESLYSGPVFLRSKSDLSVPPITIKWVPVEATPRILKQNTVFIGNPHLRKHFNLIVSDCLLSENTYIQVTNTSRHYVVLKSSYNLAVDEGNEEIFASNLARINNINTKIANSGEVTENFKLNPNLTREQREKALNLLENFRDIFVSDVSQLRRCNYPPIKIEYDKSKIIRQRNYRMSPDEKEFAEKYIQKLLKADLIEYCTSVYCTPILVVPKRSTDPNKPAFRLVQDFRKLNPILRDIKYPIPDQQELIDSFQGKFWHSVTDNCSGYTQLTMHPSCRDTTAFDSPSGSRFRWKALPQGLSVAPSIYALAMDHLLMKLKRKNKIVNYFDDSHIGTKTFDEHVKILTEYFTLLRDQNIKLNIKKSTFFQSEVSFLGLEVDGKTVKVSSKRVEAISKLRKPESTDELRSTLGIFGYNRRFIKNYSQIALPLQNLLKQGVAFDWQDEHQQSFDRLKSILTTQPALRLYNPTFNNRICTDASYKGLGVALYQQDPVTKRYHPVAFASRKLKGSEQKLPPYHLECAALVFAFVTFRCYVQNKQVETEVLTDHQSLQALLKTPKPEGPIAKHIMFLAQHKFTVKYRPGKTNLNADGLSRAPVDSPEKSVDELVDEIFPERIQLDTAINAVTTRAQVAKETANEIAAKQLDDQNQHSKKPINYFNWINNSVIVRYLQSNDHFLGKIMQELSDDTFRRNSKFHVREGLLYHNNRLAIPDNCRKYVLNEYHDNRGHRASKHLFANISDQYWWPSLRSDCELYYKSCRYCALHRDNPKAKPGFLAPVNAKRPFANIACDFIETKTVFERVLTRVCNC